MPPVANHRTFNFGITVGRFSASRAFLIRPDVLNPSLLSQYMCGVLILALHPSKRFFKSASTSFALSRIELNLSFQYFFVNFGAHSVFHHSLILFPQNENTFLISSHFSEAPVFIFSHVSLALLAISSPHTCQFFLISPVSILMYFEVSLGFS